MWLFGSIDYIWFLWFLSLIFAIMYLTSWPNSLFFRQEGRDVENSSSHQEISEKLSRMSTADASLSDWHMGFHISLVIPLTISKLLTSHMELISFMMKNVCSSFVFNGSPCPFLYFFHFNIWSSYCPSF